MTSQTLLYRQVHPAWIQKDGVSSKAFVTSQVFRPTAKDDKKLSVYNGQYFTPEQSYEHYIANNTSYGVLGLTVEECTNEELSCSEDNDTFEGHALVDFAGCQSKGVIEAKAKKLRDIALRRDWLHVGSNNSDVSEREAS